MSFEQGESLAKNAALLGVERSALGKRWVSRLDAAGETLADALAQAHGFEPALARVLAARRVGVETAPAYLAPKLRDLLPEPYTLLDMEPAVARLADAVARGEQIAIFGDYDVDGACSAAILFEWCVAAGAPPPFIHIPDRITEGYGPNEDAIRDLAARGATLLVTVDCGTVSFEPLAEARALGMDAIVFDHHLADETLPAGLIVNPNRRDDVSGQGGLCAAGVVFVALVALNRELRRRGFWTQRPEPQLIAALDAVALATVADMAPLRGVNRALVIQGVEVMRRRERVGLAALMDAARMDGPIRPYHLGYLLGPRINAGGRIGDAALGARLLTNRDGDDSRRIAVQLDRLNAERQLIERSTLESAEAAAEAEMRRSNLCACLVVADENWHPGVLGLVASKLKDKFKCPTFAIAWNGEFGSGSGRSLSDVDLGSAVRLAVSEGVAKKGGGHAMAAGVTLARDHLEAFRTFMSDALAERVAASRGADHLAIEAAVTARGVGAELICRVGFAGPFGQGNSEPIFVLPSHQIGYASVVGGAHVRARLVAGDGAGVDAIAFRSVDSPLGDALLNGRGKRFHVAARLSLNAYRGVEKPQAEIVDLAETSH
jgi:single-stranded-DNA-specific exonuclease